MPTPIFPIDFNKIRIAFARELQKVCMLPANQVILSEGEIPDVPRPCKPYFSFKLITPAAKNGDDSKDNVLDAQGNSTTKWNSGGVRKMTVAFDCYGLSHEEAYNYMGLWQTALDLEDIQEDLRRAGIAVWTIGTVADLSQLLNTGYEGRAHMECTFGIAMNLVSDLGEEASVTVQGTVSLSGVGVKNISEDAP